MSIPRAEYDVHVQRGVRSSIMIEIIPAARAEGISPRAFLNRIALEIKAIHAQGTLGPRHRKVPEDEMPPEYLEAYSDVHDELYHGVWVRYGIKEELNRLVLISMSYPPAVGQPRG